MTLKEMVKQNEPEWVDDMFAGGVSGCPADYSYLNCKDTIATCDRYGDVGCTACWNQEYSPESATEYFEVEEFLDRDVVLDLIETKLKTLDGEAFTAVRDILTKVSMLHIFEIEELQIQTTSKEVDYDSERDG